jgi:tetratricopeptide (TPR) repeat protein
MAEDAAGTSAALDAAASTALAPRGAGQARVFRLMLEGQPQAALAAVRAHLAEWPLDALVLSTTANQTGLIGLSGLAGREQDLADLLDNLAPHYGDDWWFGAHHGMALSEVGEVARARPILERSFAGNPRNGYIAHSIGHLHYETGDHAGAIAFLRGWLPGYPRAGRLHGHLHWHLALSELQSGNVAEGFRLFTEAFAAEEYHAPARLKLTDGAAFLWRAELAGHPRDPDRWRALHAFAKSVAPRPGMPLADWHVVLTQAVLGDGAGLAARAEAMAAMTASGRYPAGPAIAALGQAFAAMARQDFVQAINAIEPMLAERERIGGSRAQVDLVEATLLKAYLGAGRLAEMRRLLAARRPGAAGLPVAA